MELVGSQVTECGKGGDVGEAPWMAQVSGCMAPFMPQTFIKTLPSDKHYPRFWGDSSKQTKFMSSWSLLFMLKHR